MSDLDTYRRLIAEHGRCHCRADDCTGDLEPEDMGNPAEFCELCSHIDPYWPCPHDRLEGWPADVVAGEQPNG